MDIVTREEIRGLVASTDVPCVSIYLAVHPHTSESRSDGLRLQHLLDEAERQLVGSGLRTSEAREFLRDVRSSPGHNLVRENHCEGLAILVSSSVQRTYRLPEAFAERVVVGNRFLVSPLIRHLADDRDFFVLALSENHAKFYEGTANGLRLLDVPDMPDGKGEAQHLQGTDRGSQVHASGRVGGSRRQSAVFHGGGGRADTNRTELELYCHDVAGAVTSTLNGRTAPLIVAAVDSLQAIFAAECSYTQRVPGGVSGSPDKWSETELHARAVAAAAPALDERRHSLLKRVRDNLGTAVAVTQISEILRAAAQGRVALLAFDRAGVCRGTFRSDNLHTELHLTPQAGDDDLTDLALHLTMSHGGDVITAEAGELPDGCEAVALLRY